MLRQSFFCFVLAIVLITLQETCAQRNSKVDLNNNAQTSKTNISKGAGISAWGLVFLILSLILLGVFAYYFIIFYPILCKKERKYDRIELATV